MATVHVDALQHDPYTPPRLDLPSPSLDIRDMKPTVKPQDPHFSSGPCKKRPGWSPDALAGAFLGRSHRAAGGKAKLAEVIDRSRQVLGVPDGYRVAIVPASDTGAVEMALWSLLGARGADMLAWEAFGKAWATDVTQQLKLDDVRVLRADYGDLPDLSQVDPARDVVFTWNGTTSGVRVPGGDWIAADREGLTIVDATSAAFAMDLPWDKIDVLTYSWQKVLGGEAAHGMLILSPRAAERLLSYTPPWPLPKIFRLVKDGELIEGVFNGETLNTPSMLCVEDALDTLSWADEIGGLPALVARSEANFAVVADWVAQSDWADWLPADPATRSTTSMCLKFADPAVGDRGKAVAKGMAQLLESEGIAFDVNAYRDAPAGLRLWGGATVEADDLAALMPWLDWAYAETLAKQKAEA